MNIVFVADFFADQVLGGGELNNEELINILVSQGHSVEKVNSHAVTSEFIEQRKDQKFVIANFVGLPHGAKELFYDKHYIIYEHDHKYLSTRNPGVFPNFKAPSEHVINLEFYQNAKAVLCQSAFHTDIALKNTNLTNLVNLGGNIWDIDSLNFVSEQADVEKNGRYAIMNSNIRHKNTAGAIKFCNAKGYDYTLIQSGEYKQFLKAMGENKSLVFLPETPETLSRIVVEARMMNMGVVTNKLIGAASEPWYALKGHELIEVMKQKRSEITNKVLESLK
jgi:hypothetical protein